MKKLRTIIPLLVLASMTLFSFQSTAFNYAADVAYPGAKLVDSGEIHYPGVPVLYADYAKDRDAYDAVIGQSYDTTQWLETADFTNIAISWLPYDNATIDWVLVTTYWHFIPASNNYTPLMTLKLSINDKASWMSYGSTIPKTRWPYPLTETAITWNVTTLVAWTPALLKSQDVWAKIYTYTSAGETYYLDYVGLHYFWHVPWVPAGVLPEPPAPQTHPFAFGGFTVTSVFIGSLGAMGFIGMIAYPALAIYFHDSKDNKLGAFSNFIIGESMFIAMLWFSLAVVTGQI
jgi:hypothetical protein